MNGYLPWDPDVTVCHPCDRIRSPEMDVKRLNIALQVFVLVTYHEIYLALSNIENQCVAGCSPPA